MQKFSPYREVKLELAQDITSAQLARFNYGEVEAVNGREIRFFVKREALTGMVSKLLADLEVADLTVTDPPVEEVIGQVFRQGADL